MVHGLAVRCTVSNNGFKSHKILTDLKKKEAIEVLWEVETLGVGSKSRARGRGSESREGKTERMQALTNVSSI